MRFLVRLLSMLVLCFGFINGMTLVVASDRAPRLQNYSGLDGNTIIRRVVGVLAGNRIQIIQDGVVSVVQLRGVSSPAEVNPTREHVYHQAAEIFLEKLVLDKEVLLDVFRDAKKQGVSEAYIYRSADRLFINYQVIRLGFGHARGNPKHDYVPLFQTAEREAREEGLGL